ncbi:MATE family efflux transporter [Dysosmobacter sp.]|uniref:MATE family efflux transporter n=1 Tax=Dysosmobacter sp. TaxID=2591382 RepID=UPI002A8EA3A6|nr:MATE family efflux transporter [Dysosmobacter sp.]MDY3280846.1 MATE family efflux transporter [Dysosmobacter sp.]
MTPTSIDFSNRDLTRLIVPLIIEQLLAITVGLADSLMVAQVGEAAVSAVSLVDSVNVLLVNAFASLATGGAVVAGQYLGRREMEKANRSAQQLLLFMAELSLVLTAVLYLIRPFILHVVFGSIAEDVAAYANTYFLIVEASNVFLSVYSAGAALLRVMGNARTSMKISMVMNLINVAGNAVLIFGFRMGVAGVAIPTLVSKAVAAVLIIAVLRDRSLTLHLERPFSFRHEKAMIRNILYVGVPNGIEGSMFQLGKILLLSVVTPFGTAAVAANAVGNTICSFQVLAPQSIGLGMVTVVSRCVGAGDFRRVRAYTRKLILWGYVSLLATTAVIQLALGPILQVYGLSPEATRYAFLIITAHGLVGVLLWVPSFQLPQTLRAAGDTRFTMLTSTFSMWAFRVMLGVYFARGLQLGVLGIWGAMFVDWVFRTTFLVVRYRGHKWEFSALKD